MQATLSDGSTTFIPFYWCPDTMLWWMMAWRNPVGIGLHNTHCYLGRESPDSPWRALQQHRRSERGYALSREGQLLSRQPSRRVIQCQGLKVGQRLR